MDLILFESKYRLHFGRNVKKKQKKLDFSEFRYYTLSMTIKHKQLIGKIFDFINQILFIEKKTIFQEEGIKLFPSEIHLILFIHKEEDTNATRMAGRLGITKGAVSQNLSRLEKKGILSKIKDPYNKNELTIEFTAFGKKVLDHYLSMTAELHRQYDEYLSTLSENERDVISGFLTQAHKIMDKLEK